MEPSGVWCLCRWPGIGAESAGDCLPQKRTQYKLSWERTGVMVGPHTLPLHCDNSAVETHTLLSSCQPAFLLDLEWNTRSYMQPQILCAHKGPSGAQEASLFVEPMQWMTELSSGEVSGKLYCPKYVHSLQRAPCRQLLLASAKKKRDGL